MHCPQEINKKRLEGAQGSGETVQGTTSTRSKMLCTIRWELVLIMHCVGKRVKYHASVNDKGMENNALLFWVMKISGFTKIHILQ